MKWTVDFYDNRVVKDIKAWPLNIRAKFTWIIDLIEEQGLQNVSMPHIKCMKKGLFEIRANAHEGIGRAFFCVKKGKVIIILSAFIKKTQKTPQKELDLAIKRMKEVISDE